ITLLGSECVSFYAVDGESPASVKAPSPWEQLKQAIEDEQTPEADLSALMQRWATSLGEAQFQRGTSTPLGNGAQQVSYAFTGQFPSLSVVEVWVWLPPRASDAERQLRASEALKVASNVGFQSDAQQLQPQPNSAGAQLPTTCSAVVFWVYQ